MDGTNLEGELPTTTETSAQSEQTQETTTTGEVAVEPTVSETQFKELQAEFTRRNQELIDTKIELAKKDAKSILDIKDTKLQNKVVQEVYWLNNLKELELIHGKEFYDIKEEDEDEVAKLRKKVTLLEYNSEVWKVSQWVKEFKRLNPDLFKNNEKAEEELREKLSILSTSIPIDERIDMASKLAFGVNYINPTSDAYRELQKVNTPSWSWGAETKEPKKVENDKRVNDLREYFKNN